MLSLKSLNTHRLISDTVSTVSFFSKHIGIIDELFDTCLSIINWKAQEFFPASYLRIQFNYARIVIGYSHRLLLVSRTVSQNLTHFWHSVSLTLMGTCLGTLTHSLWLQPGLHFDSYSVAHFTVQQSRHGQSQFEPPPLISLSGNMNEKMSIFWKTRAGHIKLVQLELDLLNPSGCPRFKPCHSPKVFLSYRQRYLSD